MSKIFHALHPVVACNGESYLTSLTKNKSAKARGVASTHVALTAFC